MASRYMQAFHIPDGFPEILKNFTREILRHQPENVYEFGAQYFHDLLEKERGKAPSGGARRPHMSREELEQFLWNLFQEADGDRSGTLERKEFRELMKTAELNLNKKEVNRLFAEADEDHKGFISYNDFVPVAVEVITGIYARQDAYEETMEKEAEARLAAETFVLKGLPREEFIAMMKSVFARADKNGNGFLDRQEFLACLKNADLGLTRKEINAIMANVDEDANGKISIDEFAIVFFEVTVDIMKNEILEQQRSDDDLANYLLECFQAQDPQNSGILKPKQVRDIFINADLGLTRLQVHTIMADAPRSAGGLIEYNQLAPYAARIIYSLYDQQALLQRQAFYDEQNAQGGDKVAGRSREEFEEELANIFQQFDKDGNGVLDYNEFRECLVNSGLDLTDDWITALCEAGDENGDGVISYEEFIKISYNLMRMLQNEQKLKELQA